MNSRMTGIAVGVACLLSGCTTKAPSTPPVEPQFGTTEAQSAVQKYVVLDSHTYVYAGSKRVETQGVPCKVSGSGFAMAYASPANLRLPVFGVKTSDLSMTCTHDGNEKYKTIKVRNLTSEGIANAGANGGLIGAVIGMGIAGARGDRANDEYTYQSPIMVLNEKPKSASSKK
jgi:hypothetical protein